MFDAPARAASSGSTNPALSVAAPPYLCRPSFGHASFMDTSIQPPIDLSPPPKKRRSVKSPLCSSHVSVDLSQQHTPQRVTRSTLDSSQGSVDLSHEPTPPRVPRSNLDSSQVSVSIESMIDLE